MTTRTHLSYLSPPAVPTSEVDGQKWAALGFVPKLSTKALSIWGLGGCIPSIYVLVKEFGGVKELFYTLIVVVVI